MSNTYNIYCDESCHLPNDRQSIMTLGLIRCPLAKTKEIAIRIREIKAKHHFKKDFELKWNKVSKKKLNFYLDIVDYFFDDDDLSFRALVTSKDCLNHEKFNQTHDDWYYKMMFYLISNTLNPSDKFRIYLDKKDTCSGNKIRKLHEVLSNSQYDFNLNIIERVQAVESHSVEQLQLADFLMGAIGYLNRGLSKSQAKLKIIERIKQRSKYDLKRTTLKQEAKFNLFFWKGQE